MRVADDAHTRERRGASASHLRAGGEHGALAADKHACDSAGPLDARAAGRIVAIMVDLIEAVFHRGRNAAGSSGVVHRTTVVRQCRRLYRADPVLLLARYGGT